MEPINQLKKDELEFKQDNLDHKKVALEERVKARLGRHAEKVTGTLAAIGFIVVLIILIIGAAYAAKYAAVAIRNVGAAAVTLSSKFFPQEELIPTVNAEKIISGVPFTISWDKKNITAEGSYGLYYPCSDGLFLKAQTPDSGTQTILCNKDFDFINYDNSLTLVASSSKFNTVELPITIKFTENGQSKPTIAGVTNIKIVNDAIKISDATTSGDVLININPPVVTTGNTTGGGTYTVTLPGQTTSNSYPVDGTGSAANNPNGHPDLRPVFLEKGYLDSSNNFTTTVKTSRHAIRFKIENVGDKTSGTFRFNAYLPTYPMQIFNSDVQQSLQSGARIEYTIAFDQVLQGNQTFRIFVDPALEVTDEINRADNDLSTTINI